MEKPDVEQIEGLSPAISIEQKSTSHNPRSTVGTITEIHDYLRLLFARVGEPRCPDHAVALEAQTVTQMVDTVMSLPGGERLMLLAPLVGDRKGEHARIVEGLRSQGFIRARIDGRLHELDGPDRAPSEAETHDRGGGRPFPRTRGSGIAARGIVRDRARALRRPAPSSRRSTETARTWSSPPGSPATCAGYSIPELEPRVFSFNNPAGACQRCDGLGVQTFFDPSRIVANSELSLPGGAVRGWDRRNAYYFQMIQSLAAHYGFDLDTPFGDLPENVRHVVLDGSGLRGHPVHLPYRAPREPRPEASVRRRHSQHGSAVPGDGVERGSATSWPSTSAAGPANPATVPA